MLNQKTGENLGEAKKAREEAEKLAKKISSIFDRNKTPAEKFKTSMQELIETFEAAKLDPNIEFTQQTFDREKKRLEEEFGKTVLNPDVVGSVKLDVAAVTRGSVDAFVQSRQRNTPEQELVKQGKLSQKALDRLVKLNEELVKEMKDSGLTVASI